MWAYQLKNKTKKRNLNFFLSFTANRTHNIGLKWPCCQYKEKPAKENLLYSSIPQPISCVFTLFKSCNLWQNLHIWHATNSLLKDYNYQQNTVWLNSKQYLSPRTEINKVTLQILFVAFVGTNQSACAIQIELLYTI